MWVGCLRFCSSITVSSCCLQLWQTLRLQSTQHFQLQVLNSLFSSLNGMACINSYRSIIFLSWQNAVGNMNLCLFLSACTCCTDAVETYGGESIGQVLVQNSVCQQATLFWTPVAFAVSLPALCQIDYKHFSWVLVQFLKADYKICTSLVHAFRQILK